MKNFPFSFSFYGIKQEVSAFSLLFFLTSVNAADCPDMAQLSSAQRLQIAINNIPPELIQNSLNFTAALIGSSEAQFEKGWKAYEKAKSTQKDEDFANAYDWFFKAAGQGHEAAKLMIKEFDAFLPTLSKQRSAEERGAVPEEELKRKRDNLIIGSQFVSTLQKNIQTSVTLIDYDDFTPEHRDYFRLKNISYLLQNTGKMHPLTLLKNISWQVDGMQVLKRSLRDRTETVLPVWSSLAYLHKGLSLEEASDEFLLIFVRRFLPLLEDLPMLLAKIEELETIKADIRKMRKNLPSKIAQERYTTVCQNTAAAQMDSDPIDPVDVLLFSIISKNPVYDNLQKIQRCTLFTHEYKFEKAMECVKGYLLETSGNLESIEEAKKAAEEKEKEYQAKVNILNTLSSAKIIERLVGVLYEYESLKEAHSHLEELEKLDLASINWSTDSFNVRVLLYNLTLAGEALNNISTPLSSVM